MYYLRILKARLAGQRDSRTHLGEIATVVETPAQMVMERDILLTPPASAPTLRVGIYRTSSIGDVVLATALLDILEQLPVPTEITWLGRNPSLNLLASAWPNLRTVEIKRTSSLSDQQQIAANVANLHLLIDLQCNIRSRWLARTLTKNHGVPVFSTHKAQLHRNRLIVEARLRGRRRPLPESSRHPQLLQFEMMANTLKDGLRHHLPVEMRDGLEHMVFRPRLPFDGNGDSPLRPWQKELRFGAWLAIAPGAAHPTKQAPYDSVAEILQIVEGHLTEINDPGLHPLGLVFLGDESDRHITRQILDHLNWQGPVLNLAGRLSLWETAIALSEASGLLSNDSSLGHIAEAVDTPVAIMFGPTIEGFGFPPRMRQSRAFSVLLGCRPCSKHGKVPCRFGDKLCFAGLPLHDIAQHLLGLLMAPDAKHRRRLNAINHELHHDANKNSSSPGPQAHPPLT